MRKMAALAVVVAVFVLPSAGWTSNAAACERSRGPVRIDLNNERHAHVLDHAWDATDEGHPRLLHLDRDGAAQNRRESLRGIPTRPGFDRDEYPPAVSREGGRGADVRYVESSENRSGGSLMGRILRRWCDGQSFRFERRPRR